MVPAAIDFRKADQNDLGALISLMNELVAELGTAGSSGEIEDAIPQDVADALASDSVQFFVATANDQLVALSRADILTTDPIFRLRRDNRCGYVDQMYVHPDFRQRGLGQKLLELCEDFFREHGIAHCLLHASHRAVHFYARSGYQPNREMFKRLR